MYIGLKGGTVLRKKTHISWLFIFVLLISGLQPIQTTRANGSSIIISSDQTNIREGPGLSYSKIGQVNSGDTFPVIKESGDWIQIQLKNDEKGWVANWLVTFEQSTDSSLELKKGKSISISGDQVRVRSGPGTKYKILDSVDIGQSGVISELSSDWVKITYDGQAGWVSSQYVEMKKQQATKEKTKSSSSNSATQKVTGTVTATTLYVRKDGALDGEIIAEVYQGDQFPILEEVNNFIKIEYKSGSFGWVASWYMEKSLAKSNKTVSKKGTIEIIFDGTNIRSLPNVESEVVQRANEGDTFKTNKLTNEWYEIRLDNGKTAYVAQWLVQDLNGSQIEKPDSGVHLKNKTIVIDPGHGGKDHGTQGYKGTSEKNVTMQTASILSNKLKAAGANVILTRKNDSFLSLSSRVRLSHYHAADAFISIHYDSIEDSSVRGTTSFYNHPFQKPLASSLHSAIVQSIGLKDRGVRYGDYHVLRENKRNAALLELGYLSNSAEENIITSSAFQEKAASGIYRGLEKYFNK